MAWTWRPWPGMLYGYAASDAGRTQMQRLKDYRSEWAMSTRQELRAAMRWQARYSRGRATVKGNALPNRVVWLFRRMGSDKVCLCALFVAIGGDCVRSVSSRTKEESQLLSNDNGV